MQELLKQQSLFPTMSKDAIFSDDRKYRFVLSRIWDNSLPKIMFIGLNPSTANENTDDPTIRRVISFAKSWGFGGVYMLNLFTYVTAYPEKLMECDNPVFMADEYLYKYAEKSVRIVFAWGNFSIAKERGWQVSQLFVGYCFGKNRNGSPKHPLYIAANTELIKY